MIKIFDNSVISSMGREITSVDVLPLVKSEYDIRITNAVITECRNSGNEKLIRSMDGLLLAVEADYMFVSVVNSIKIMHPQLGSGEIESIAASILMTRSGIDNYVVLDDGLARKIVSDLHNDLKLQQIVGTDIPPIKYTGTVGLIKHLRDKGIISREIYQKIAYDLKNSGFRITDSLLDLR